MVLLILCSLQQTQFAHMPFESIPGCWFPECAFFTPPFFKQAILGLFLQSRCPKTMCHFRLAAAHWPLQGKRPAWSPLPDSWRDFCGSHFRHKKEKDEPALSNLFPMSTQVLSAKSRWLWLSKPMVSHFGWVHLVYFSGDWDVHWGYGILTHGELLVDKEHICALF